MYLINHKRFILNNIEVMLDHDLNPSFIEETLQQQPLPELLDMLRKSATGAIQSLKAFRYEIPAEDFGQLSQRNYSDLFRLMDRVLVLQQSEAFMGLSEHASTFYQMLGLALESVENHLESIGIHSLGPEEYLPDYFRESRIEILRQETLIFQSRCKARAIDPALTELLLDYLQTFTGRNSFTQQALNYMEKLMAALLKLLNGRQEGSCDIRLMNMLIAMNFNSPELYKYCSSKIADGVEESATLKRKLMALNWHFKELKHLLPAEGMALNPKYPQLKTLLLDFMLAEIGYLERELEEQFCQPMEDAGQNTKITFRNDTIDKKVHLQFSQRILAIWSQTMISANLIRLGTGGQRGFTNFLADHFTTIGQETIHPNNIRRRYKEKHTAASETLIGMLEELIRVIKQEYMGINSSPKK